MEPASLPKTWQSVQVAEICQDIRYGYTESASSERVGPRFLRISDIQNGQVDWATVPFCKIEDTVADGFTLRIGDLVFARTGGTVGKSYLIHDLPEKTVFASYLIRLSLAAGVSPRFTYYFFQSGSYWEQIGLKKAGLKANVNAAILGSLTMPLPPANEQTRIVAKIDELLSELDNGVDILKIARAQLNVYRKAVLKAAFEGKLTAQWRLEKRNLIRSSADLINDLNVERERRHRQALKKKMNPRSGSKSSKPSVPPPIQPLRAGGASTLPELPEGWTWVSLDSICDVSGGLTKNQNKRRALSRRINYLRVANVYADRLDLDDVHRIAVTDDEAAKVTLQSGDLLIVEGNGSVEQIGRVAMWAGELSECGHQNHLIRARMQVNSSPRFLLQFLLSPLGRELIVKQASSTTGLHTLSISKVSSLAVPLIGDEEQSVLLQLIDERLSQVDAMCADIDTQLARANTLRQSILKKAFAGQLISQDPTDEPASVLLARILADRKVTTVTLKMRQTSKKRKTAA